MRPALRPLSLPAFRRLAVVRLVDELGDWLGEIALAVLVFDQTGSPMATAALFLALQFVPAITTPPLVARLESLPVRVSSPAPSPSRDAPSRARRPRRWSPRRGCCERETPSSTSVSLSAPRRVPRSRVSSSRGSALAQRSSPTPPRLPRSRSCSPPPPDCPAHRPRQPGGSCGSVARSPTCVSGASFAC